MTVVTESRHGRYAEEGSERSLSPSSPTVRFQMALPQELKDRVEERAQAEGRDKAKIIRDSIEMYLDTELPDPV